MNEMKSTSNSSYFNCSKLLDGIRETIGPDDFYRYNPPLEEYEDRYIRIDTHFIFAVSLYFSSKHALNEKNIVLASIGQYYCLYHLGFSLVSLNMSIKNENLQRLSHSQLKKLLSDLIHRKIVSHKFMDLYEDLQSVREYYNYLSMENGIEKYTILSTGHKISSKSFGDIHMHDINLKSEERLYEIIKDFFSMLNEIELKLISNRKTNGHRPELFRSIRRVSDFNHYGENSMIFYPDEVVKNIEVFFAQNDVEPDTEYHCGD